MTATVFPVGHYGGTRLAGASAAGESHAVRIGWRMHRLDEDAFGVWVLSHGVADFGKGTWTVDDILGQAEDVRLREPKAHLDDLLERGLLAAVPVGAGSNQDVTAFARRHRMDPLFVGLGNSPDRPDEHAIGIPGVGAAAVLDQDSYDLWQWGGLAPTLLHLSEVRASVASRLGEKLDDPLGQILGDLRFLLVHGCAYLDLADPLSAPS